MNSPAPKPSSGPRRHLTLALAVLLLAAGLGLRLADQQSEATFASAAMLRIGLVLGMLWFAWPSLRRPASWVPPGIAVAVVVALIIVAAQPRLILFVLPVAGVLVTAGAFVRAFRRRR